jgi:MFS family permease
MTAIARGRSLPMWRALAIPDFRLLWTSETVSVIGDQFHFVALSWLVITLTGSGLALGTVLIAVAVPRAILLVPFGVLADRRPPRRMMITAHLGRAAIVGVIAILVGTGLASLPVLVVLGALFGLVDAMYLPAQQAFLPRAVDADRLPSANALLQGTLQLASIAGPPLAGVAVALAGTGVAFGVDAASFLVAAVLIAMMTGVAAATVVRSDRPDGTPAAPQESFGRALREGIGYVARDPAIRTLMLLSLVLNFALNGPAAVGMAWLAERRFDAGPAGLGMMAAGWAAGGLAGTLLAGNARLDRQGNIVIAGVGIAGLSLMALGVLGWLPGVIVALAVMGVAIGYVNIVAVSWLQARVAPDVVGRVMSLVMLMGFGISPLSIGLSGALIDLDATALFVGAGLVVITTGLVAIAVRFPAELDVRPAAATSSFPPPTDR